MAQRPVTPEELARAKVESIQMLRLSGFIWGRVFDDGRCIYLAPNIPGRYILGIARSIDARRYDAAWVYEATDVAWHAAIGWDGHGEPEGFLRRASAYTA